MSYDTSGFDTVQELPASYEPNAYYDYTGVQAAPVGGEPYQPVVYTADSGLPYAGGSYYSSGLYPGSYVPGGAYPGTTYPATYQPTTYAAASYPSAYQPAVSYGGTVCADGTCGSSYMPPTSYGWNPGYGYGYPYSYPPYTMPVSRSYVAPRSTSYDSPPSELKPVDLPVRRRKKRGCC
eukprot:Selendium_serpulae@DN5846_c0_g1_i5.p1